MRSYNTYDFNPDTPFIPISGDCTCNCGDVIVDVDGIMEAIEDAKNEVKEQLQEQFKDTNKHIHCSTEHIIDKIPLCAMSLLKKTYKMPLTKLISIPTVNLTKLILLKTSLT